MTLAVVLGFLLTLVAHIAARWLGVKFKGIPVVVVALILVLVLLKLFSWRFDDYYSATEPLFNALLGYVTVALAIPLAAMRFDDLHLRRLLRLLVIATLTGVAIPMSFAYFFSLSHEYILGFATRAVTTPIALNVADIIHAPKDFAVLIVVISGLLGAALSPLLLKGVNDDRAKGLALGLVAHAIGTVEAWQISPTAGRFAAFGMAVNGMLTAVWLPLVFTLLF